MPYNKLLGIQLAEPFHGPFFLQGSLLSLTNDTAIFAILGWSEQPQSMQPFAQKMQNLGHSVAVPSYLINQVVAHPHLLVRPLPLPIHNQPSNISYAIYLSL